MLADFSAHLDIFRLYGACFRQQALFYFRDAVFPARLDDLSHARKRPREIDRRRPRGIQRLPRLGKFFREYVVFRRIDSLGRKVNPVGRRHADCRRTANLQQINRVPYFLLRCQAQDFLLVRQARLVDDDESRSLVVQRDCLKTELVRFIRVRHASPSVIV